MWAWIYEGVVIGGSPFFIGCSSDWVLYTLWNGMYSAAGECWLQGVGLVQAYYPGFTLQ